MKKIIAILLALTICFAFSACGQKIESITLEQNEVSVRVEDTLELGYKIVPADIENPKLKWSSSDNAVVSVDETGKITAIAEGTATVTVSAGKASASCEVTVGKKASTKTDYITIDGMYLDETYTDKNSESIRLLYLFYTATTPDQNLKVDSKSMKITFGSQNTYTAEHIPGACKYSEYYYSSYLKEIFKGEKLTVVETFKIPVSELEKGVEITFEKSQIPQTEDLIYLTDDVALCEGAQAVAEKADPKGYKSQTNKMKQADAQTEAKVKGNINGYEWSFYVNSTSYKIIFSSPNRFKLVTIYNTVNGTYTVKNGYVTLNYPNGYTVDIPYRYEGEKIKLSVADAFDVMKN